MTTSDRLLRLVATATKALQAQLVDQDLPRLVAAPTGALGRTLPPFHRARSREAVPASLRAIDASAPPVRPVGSPPACRRASGSPTRRASAA